MVLPRRTVSLSLEWRCFLVIMHHIGTSVPAVFPAGQTVYGYCTRTGYTNWAGALLMALQYPWQNTPVPDIYVWFTDGYPEYSGDYVPQTTCDAACYDQTNSFFSDICNPLTNCPLSNGATGLQNLWTTLATPQVPPLFFWLFFFEFLTNGTPPIKGCVGCMHCS